MFIRYSLSLLGTLVLIIGSGCGDSSPTTPPSNIRPIDEPGAKSKREGKADAPISPEEAQAAQAIIDKAIKAHAGTPDRLDKLKLHTSVSKGTMYSAYGPMTATSEIRAVWPDRIVLDVLLDTPMGQQRTRMVITGEGGWARTSQGETTDLDTDHLREVRNDLHAIWIASLLPFKEDPPRIALLPEAKIGTAEAAGIKAMRRLRPDISLWFDKQTGLLLKMTYRGREGGVDANKEVLFSDYKDFGGIRLASKQVQFTDSRKSIEWTSTEYAFPEQLDKGLFDKPKGK